MVSFDTTDVTSPKNMSLLFRLSMWWKIFYGLIRIVLGLVLLNLIGTPFSDIFYNLMSHELTIGRGDIVFQFIYHFIHDRSFTVTYFVSIYVLFWGTIDVIFSILLLKHKLWAFPMSLYLMGLFILYEIYRVIHTQSLILLALICMGIGIMFIVYAEYKALLKKDAPAI